MINHRGRSDAGDDPDEEQLDEEDLYDDSLGYGEDDVAEEEAEYDDFLEREFGIRDAVRGRGGARLSSWQYYTVFVVLVAFTLPLILLLFQALAR